MNSNTRSFATIIAPYQIAHTGTNDIVQKTTNKCMTNYQVQCFHNISERIYAYTSVYETPSTSHDIFIEYIPND